MQHGVEKDTEPQQLAGRVGLHTTVGSEGAILRSHLALGTAFDCGRAGLQCLPHHLLGVRPEQRVAARQLGRQ